MAQESETEKGGRGPSAGERGARLDSWKEIAAYLNRDVRTVQRWEKTAALPVRRLQKPGLRAVYAYVADLDEWRRGQDPLSMDDSGAQVMAPPPTEAARPPEPTPRRRWLPLAAAAVGLAVVIVAVGSWLRGGDLALPPFGPLTSRPLTSDPGNERDPEFSADGKYVAYVSDAPNGKSSLVVRLVDTGDARTLATGALGELWSPTWSPDGARIAFLRGDPARQATLTVAPVLGGAERTVATLHPYPRRRSRLGHLLAWTPDGRFIIAADQVTPGTGRLVRLDVGTGDRTPITSPDDGHYDVEPSMSRDGRLLFFSRVRTEFLSDAYVQPLDAASLARAPARRLPGAGPWNGTPRLLEGRGEVLTSAGALPRLSLWRQPLDGSSSPVPLSVIGDIAVQSTVSGGRIVVRTFRSQGDVVRFPMPGRGAGPQASLEEFAQSTYVDVAAVYSPDGSEVAFISDRTGSRQLWVADATGSSPVEWSQPFEADVPMPSWSPDGTRLAFAGIGPSGNTQLFVGHRATRKAAAVTNDTRNYERPVWSPDGAFLYATAAVKGVYTLYRLPSEGGAAVKVVADYVRVVGVGPRGDGLYAVRQDQPGPAVLEYVPLPSGTPVPVATLTGPDDAWVTADGVYLVERRTPTAPSPVALVFRTHDGAVTALAEYARAPGRGLSVSPDGRFALTTRVTVVNADLLLLEPAR